MKALGYKHTVTACCIGYAVQAIIVNFAPLLFLTFNSTYHISLTAISIMITVTFAIQLGIDLFTSVFIQKIGYRRCIITAHFLAAVGLILLSVLPEKMPSPTVGLFIAAIIYAMGGGLIEAVVSPLVEACPIKNKSSALSFLHSFYCWGQMLVIALSTLFFVLLGIEKWNYLALIWATIPLCNAVYFCFVPIYTLEDNGESMPVKSLFKSKTFLLFALLFVCAGASELCVSQWASAFVESGLGVSKTTGDLLGPCLFAVCMGTVRVLFSVFGKKISIKIALVCSACGCIVGYGLCAFASYSWAGLVGCSVVGLSVAIMWPGTLSYAAKEIPHGGTAMFALLALFGDAGCSIGPTAVGTISDAFQGNIRIGIAFGLLIPTIMLFALLFSRIKPKRQQ